MIDFRRSTKKQKEYLFLKAKKQFEKLPSDKQTELIATGDGAFDNLDPFTQERVSKDIQGLGMSIGKCMAITAIAQNLR